MFLVSVTSPPVRYNTGQMLLYSFIFISSNIYSFSIFNMKYEHILPFLIKSKQIRLVFTFSRFSDAQETQSVERWDLWQKGCRFELEIGRTLWDNIHTFCSLSFRWDMKLRPWIIRLMALARLTNQCVRKTENDNKHHP